MKTTKKKIISKKRNSKFFQFNNNKIKKTMSLTKHKGWNKSIIAKFCFNSKGSIDRDFIKKKFPQIYNKEKIFIVTSGAIRFNSNKLNLRLKKLDALSIFLDNFNYSFTCKKNSQLYIVGSEKIKKQRQKSRYFNFKRDIKPIDIWGGKCLSRPYCGQDLNVVLFDLKKGFKFNDEGHSNEQITWLISGSMIFYSGKLKNKLTPEKGIDIGYFHKHGGISKGAIGFDAFFPKRFEKKYRNIAKVRSF